MKKVTALTFCALVGLIYLLQLFNNTFWHELSFAPGLPDEYEKNSWTAQSMKISGGRYYYNYKFKDHTGTIKTWSWSVDKAGSDAASRKLGVPKSFFEPYYNRPDVIRARNKIMKEGFCTTLTEAGRTVINIDYGAAAVYYKTWAASLAGVWKNASAGQPFRKRIDLLLAFCQDIPYGSPPSYYEGKWINGCFPPPVMLNLLWGDCDCKSVLFSSVLLSEKGFNPIVLRDMGNTHVFAGIEAIPGAYDNSVKYMGKTYVICEPVGPGHSKMGEVWDDYSITHFYPVDGSGAYSSESDDELSSEEDDDDDDDDDDDEEEFFSDEE